MKPALEAPRSQFDEESISVYERREREFAWNWHYHPEIELTLIKRGSGRRLVGDSAEVYGPGDLVLLGPNLPHTWFNPRDRAQDRSGNSALVIQFRPSAIPEALGQLPEFARVRDLLTTSGRGYWYPKATSRRLTNRLDELSQTNGLDRWLRLVSILHDLAACPGKELASIGYQHRRVVRSSSRLERVTRHITENCSEELPLPDVAASIGLSPAAFSRFFHKMTGTTFVEFRNHSRVREACRRLVEGDQSVTEIAYACGFRNLANFNRRFRSEVSMTPREYRRLHEPPRGAAAKL